MSTSQTFGGAMMGKVLFMSRWIVSWYLLCGAAGVCEATQKRQFDPSDTGDSFPSTSNARMVSSLDDLLVDYDRRVSPGEFLSHLKEENPDAPFIGGTTHVNIELLVRAFGAVNADTMDYDLELYLRESWDDIRFTSLQFGSNSRNDSRLDLNDATVIKAIWKPDIYFPNAKEGYFHFVTVPNVLLRIETNGRVLYTLRLKLRFSCMLDLTSYPLDRQECYIELATFARTNTDVMLHWNGTAPLTFNRGIKMANFELEKVEHLNSCPRTNIEHIDTERSCLSVRLSLKRAIGHHLVQSFLPSILIVVISWVSFWLDVDAIPARVTLGVTTLLTISAESSDKQANLAPVAYVKALDIWMAACTMFVFTAVLEFTCVSYLARLRSAGEHPNPIIPEEVVEFMAENRIDRQRVEILASANAEERKFRKLARRVDRASRLGFPVAFGIFNSLYWSYYMN